MKNAAKYMVAGAAIVVLAAAPAKAADIYDVPPVADVPLYDVPEYVPASVSGWYLRGDVGYSWNKFKGSDYVTYDPLLGPAFDGRLDGDIKKSYSVGAGAGYKFNHYLRADLTLDYDFKTDFEGRTSGFGCSVAPAAACVSTDVASWSAYTLMANAYVDFGTYGRFTPYAGAGFGGAHVQWDDLVNTECEEADPTNCATFRHGGRASWRFAWALMAGASVDINCKLAADVGYRYRKIEGGEMFGIAAGVGPGYDRGLTSHQVKAGLRYKFGKCSQPTEVVYQPEPLPPVYK